MCLLSHNEDLLVKRVDKVGAMVIWGRAQYVKDAQRQLHNSESYASLLYNTLEYMKCELDILNNAITFYMLPKINKDVSNPTC